MRYQTIVKEFLLIIALMVLANILIQLAQTENIRTSSLKGKIAEIKNIPQSSELELLVIGDSRSAEIKTDILAKALGKEANKVYNASVTAGCWASSYHLTKNISDRLNKDSTIVLCVSEYWLERPNVEENLGLYPFFSDYFKFDIQFGVSSLIPLSLKRNALSDRLNSGITKIINLALSANDIEKFNTNANDSVFVLGPGNLALCNVDLWFSPVSLTEIEKNFAQANKALSLLTKFSENIIIVYLPNAESREKYVNTHYPDRQKRFFSYIEKISDLHSIPFINLRNILNNDTYYKDYHHWNPTGGIAGSTLVGNNLKDYL
tara:strand:- start:176 stop:1135 length:960 start_codon:yes stop_codon:yes gene_type:complete